jgi:hypothetical protein
MANAATPNSANPNSANPSSGSHSALAQARRHLDALLRSTLEAATAYHRPDLAARIERAIERHTDRHLTVLVAGEFKQGKSTLINAVLNAPVCGVADDVSTAVPTTIRHGATARATVHFLQTADGSTRDPVEITIDDVARLASEQGNPGNREGIRSVEVTLPRKLLEPGLTIIDTPGVGGLDSVHGAITQATLGMAEVILFVTDASQPLTASEVDFLRAAHAQCPNVVVVQPKTDIHPGWRRVVETNRELLAGQGLQVEVLPVSSTLRQEATRSSSTELNDESGFPPLMTLLRDAGSGSAARLQATSTLADAMFVIDQLLASFETELAALDDPESAASVIHALEAAKQHADHLRSQSAKWQQTLNDGAQDLTSDMDHDLRLRVRAILAEAETVLDDNDPADMWDDFEQWLHRRIGYDLSAHHQRIAQRSNELAALVAEHFAADEQALGVRLDLAVPTIAARGLRDDLELRRTGLTGSALAAVRGSYGGLLMFGMVGQMAGFAMLNPFSMLIGIGLGRRGLREEKKRQLTQRQQQAKMTTRKYLDDINVEAGKTSRDTVRRAHRDLRDEFADRADQLQATIRESLRSAEAGMKEAVADRQQRVANVKAELGRIEAVRARAVTIADAIGGGS